MDFRQQLGANLKRLREEAGLSQEGLMWLSDVHRTQISKYERGETEPQAEVLAEFFLDVGWQQDPPRLVIARRQPRRATLIQPAARAWWCL